MGRGERIGLSDEVGCPKRLLDRIPSRGGPQFREDLGGDVWKTDEDGE